MKVVFTVPRVESVKEVPIPPTVTFELMLGIPPVFAPRPVVPSVVFAGVGQGTAIVAVAVEYEVIPWATVASGRPAVEGRTSIGSVNTATTPAPVVEFVKVPKIVIVVFVCCVYVEIVEGETAEIASVEVGPVVPEGE